MKSGSRRSAARVVGTLVVVLSVSSAGAGDWPMWRYDGGRSASSPAGLPARMKLLWRRTAPAPAPAWPGSQHKLQFDVCYEPVAAGKLLFVPSNVSDRVTAYETETGEERWRFYAEGPVRFAPVVHDDKVLFASDDGYLYCLRAADGECAWKFLAAPAAGRVIGNNRLTSAWPVRGGPALADGKVYVAASIWPFMGIFYHCLDASSGRALWTNSGEGARWTVHPHGAPSFGSVVPHGYLAVADGSLMVPGGRSTPGVLDAATGAYRYFHYDKKRGGGGVFARRGCFFNSGTICKIADGKPVGKATRPVLSDDGPVTCPGPDQLEGFSWGADEKEVADRRGRKQKTVTLKRLWQARAPGFGRLMIRAGARLYGASGSTVTALDLPVKNGAAPAWKADVEGDIGTMLAADGKLFVATRQGDIYCFGTGGPAPARRHAVKIAPLAVAAGPWKAKAAAMVASCGARKGYAMVLGVGSGRLVKALVDDSALNVIVVESDGTVADAFRRKLDDAGLYGRRVTVVVGDPLDYPVAPYLAALIATEEARAIGYRPGGLSRTLLNTLRPYGGSLWLPVRRRDVGDPTATGVGNLVVRETAGTTVVRREGPLSGSDVWSHQYGDAANQAVNEDDLVKLPLGLLWFGGPSNDKILPRHGHGPSPQVAGGRLVIEGADILRCVDVYTGTVFWEKTLPGIGAYYNHTSHHPGAGAIGGNTITLPDAVYAVYKRGCLKLDPDTGETVREFTGPARDGARPHWGYIGAAGDLLVAGISPMVAEGGKGGTTAAKPPAALPADAVPVIKRGDSWRYLADGLHAPDGWTKVDFDASRWKTGRAGFGYGDGDDRTELRGMRGKYRSVYIRKTFDGAAVENAPSMGLVVNYDDGFVAYLNGVEVVRAGVAGRGAKVGKVSSHEAQGHKLFPIRGFREHVRPGRNCLALEGHNSSTGSSDFTLDPYLVVGRPRRAAPGPEPTRPGTPEPPAAAGKSIASGVPGVTTDVQYATSSARLVVMDRHTGDMLWSRNATYAFRHNGIALGGGKVFCLDRLAESAVAALRRRGFTPPGNPALYALDAKTGKVVWRTTRDVFGTWLGYSKSHDVLVQGGSKFRDRARDEVGKGVVAYRGATGEILWRDMELGYAGPLLIHGEELITNGTGGWAIALSTGKRTGWTWRRHYGCNTAIGSRHLLTFRSGAAGFCDLEHRSGTGNFGGFKSSCTSNLIPADGVLNAPDYTRTCSCAYQNQSSLALVHMPGAEAWTFGGTPGRGTLGVNLGAPGNRRGPDGTLWLDVPGVGGESGPDGVATTPGGATTVRHHASRIEGGPLGWVAASGLEGLTSVKLRLPAGAYTVRLVFAELAGLSPGDRVFSVALNGRPAVRDFDIARHAGGPFRSITKEIRRVTVRGELTIALTPSRGKTLLCGVQAVRE